MGFRLVHSVVLRWWAFGFAVRLAWAGAFRRVARGRSAIFRHAAGHTYGILRHFSAIISFVNRSEMPTVRVKPAPVLLVVDSSSAFVRRCADIAIQGQALAVESTMQSIAKLATQTRAFAILVPAKVHTDNEAFFKVMIRETGLELIVVPDENIATPELESAIFTAMDAAEKARLAREAQADHP